MQEVRIRVYSAEGQDKNSERRHEIHVPSRLSQTTGTSETEGTTHGTSQSRTAGTSETIQKRALITPDEIGQVFARIDDRARVAYPGLALAVISGARPVVLRRVHYYENFQFMGLFDPHPDYPYAAPKELTVEGRTLGFSLAAFGLRLGSWSITAGQIAAPGDEGALVVTTNGTTAAIRLPRGGKITAVESATGGDVPEGRLFSLLYYEDGAALADPFAELRAFWEKVKASLEEDRRAADQKRKKGASAAGTSRPSECPKFMKNSLSAVPNFWTSHRIWYIVTV